MNIAWPTAGLLLGAVISGLAWIPLRAIEELGVPGLWIAFFVILVGCVPVIPGLLKLRGLDRQAITDLLWIGLLLGVAWTFYTASLTATNVARAVLLFYMAPVWSTLLEVFILRQPITLRRAAALALGAGGLVTILGVGGDLAFSFNLGDAMALLSGMLWSLGLLIVFRRKHSPLGAQSFALSLGSLAGAAALVVALEPAPAPDIAILVNAAPWIAFAGICFILPLWVLSLWAGRFVPPARATLIFMAEVCVGIGSAALWADQAFGLREIVGTALILAAAAVEFTGGQPGALATERSA